MAHLVDLEAQPSYGDQADEYLQQCNEAYDALFPDRGDSPTYSTEDGDSEPEERDQGARDLSPEPRPAPRGGLAAAAGDGAADPPDGDGGGDDEPAPGVHRLAGAAFRFNACHVLLTYAQAPNLTFDKIEAALRDRFHAEKWSIGKELHRDGGTHWHVYAYRRNRFNTNANVRYFDIDGYHPNIHSCKRGKEQGAIYYTQKDGDFRVEGIRDFPTPRNFTRAHQDLEQWHQYCRFQRLKPVDWTARMPTGEPIGRNDPAVKKRHWIIIGPPDYNKTRWCSERFAGQRVYYVPTKSEDRAPAPWDGYKGEELLIYDDVLPLPTKPVLCLLTDTVGHDRQLCGRGTYGNKLIPANTTRTILILCNPESVPSYLDELWFRARFNVINLEEPIQL